MSISTTEHLEAMINDIARNHGYLPPAKAGETVAAHIRRFWAPSMIEQLLVHLSDNADLDGLEPGAAEAVSLLRAQCG